MQNNNLLYEKTFFPIKYSNLDEKGTFEGYASIFNNIDSHLESVMPGAFKDDIKNKENIKVLWQHNQNEIIGKMLEIKEDAIGLFVKIQLILEIPKASEAYILLKNKILTGMSIGYKVEKFDFDRSGIKQLKKINLVEISLVTFPSNPKATISSIKNENSSKEILNSIQNAKQKLLEHLVKVKSRVSRT